MWRLRARARVAEFLQEKFAVPGGCISALIRATVAAKATWKRASLLVLFLPYSSSPPFSLLHFLSFSFGLKYTHEFEGEKFSKKFEIEITGTYRGLYIGVLDLPRITLRVKIP